MDNLNCILGNLDIIKSEGKINVYAIKNIHKPKNKSFAFALPSNENTKFLREYCNYLENYNSFSCVKYDAVEYKESTYEVIDLLLLTNVWGKLFALINSSNQLQKNSYLELINEVNLTICELDYKNQTYFLCTIQESTSKTFKGKFPFLVDEGKLTSVDPQKILSITFNVDFIVDPLENKVFIFNRKRFEKVFNYYEVLKKHVIEQSSVIDNWTFLANSDFIKTQIETTYIFKSLSRIIDDKAYLSNITKTTPRTLKKRLLEKCSDVFSEEDFKNDKLEITKANLENIIKMITKGFKYNFFTDKAED